jgi:cardiolipin synthase
VRYFDASMPTVNIKPTFISKVNTALQLVLMGSTLAVPALGLNDTKMIQTALQVMQYTVGGTTVLSGLSYLLSKDTIQILRRKRQKNSSITKNIN